MSRRVASLWLHVALIALALLTVTPLLWMVSASFMRPGEANNLPPPLLPAVPTTEHYVALLTRLDLLRNALNSLLIAGVTTLVSLLLNAMAGYAFAKLRFGGRDRLFGLLLVGLVVPAQVGMLPLFLMVQKIGLVNTPWGVMIPGLASIFGIFMVRQYALGIPDELLDAAVLPLLRPILVTWAVFSFLSQWNDFLWPLIVLSDERKFTLPVALASLVGEHVQDTELMMAGSVITVIPVLALFLALQRSYIRGVMMGSLKG
ncbi:MAG: carbohydrate ABC transporter permease [Candidatus Eisenbacteria bacterium]|uniref:Carbohydrate ABC transporter permease n=1 Tax=Eiseniibacteriota bacterium TaxID=2212470 RepID=A0A538U186_UNCEI|nr:MAG: carbohydrate ABC transporter permease [Candidatus Eisenbacteria bacterium]